MVQAARHQVVAGPFRGRTGEHRRLDVDEALLAEVGERLDREVGPQPQVALQTFPPQIEEAVLEARLLARVLRALHREGHRLRASHDPPLPNLHLDLAGRHLRVDLVRVAPHDLALDLDDVLETRGVQGLGHLRRALGVDDGLDDAAPVANVQEDHAAVIATAVDPPLDLRLFADLVGRQGSCPGSLHLLIRCAVLLAGPAFRASRRPVREAPILAQLPLFVGGDPLGDGRGKPVPRNRRLGTLPEVPQEDLSLPLFVLAKQHDPPALVAGRLLQSSLERPE